MGCHECHASRSVTVMTCQVRRMLAEIREGGEEVARSYAERLDRYTGNIVLSEQEIQEAVDMIPEQVSALRILVIDRTVLGQGLHRLQCGAGRQVRLGDESQELRLGGGARPGLNCRDEVRIVSR